MISLELHCPPDLVQERVGLTSQRISVSSFHKANAHNVYWPSPACHFYMLRMSTPGLPPSRLNRSVGSAHRLHTVHSKTWGGSRSTWAPPCLSAFCLACSSSGCTPVLSLPSLFSLLTVLAAPDPCPCLSLL